MIKNVCNVKGKKSEKESIDIEIKKGRIQLFRASRASFLMPNKRRVKKKKQQQLVHLIADIEISRE